MEKVHFGEESAQSKYLIGLTGKQSRNEVACNHPLCNCRDVIERILRFALVQFHRFTARGQHHARNRSGVTTMRKRISAR